MKRVCLLISVILAASFAFSGCGENDSEVSSVKSDISEKSTISDESIKSDSSKEENSRVSSGESIESIVSEDELKEVEASWFDDAVFVGDSVTLKLSYYVDNGSLGDAKFLCAGSLGYGWALQDLDAEGNVHPTYEGEQYTVDDGIKMLEAKKVFIMFGMNDIGLFGIDESVQNMKTLTERILEKSPKAEIYIQSVTPMLEEAQLVDLNNKSISEFNEKLKKETEKLGYKYLDVASVLKDEKGNLLPEYCSDPESMGIHLTDEGCEVWIKYLKTHVE